VVPKDLSEEQQAEKKEQILIKRKEIMKGRVQKYIEEEKEEEFELKLEYEWRVHKNPVAIEIIELEPEKRAEANPDLDVVATDNEDSSDEKGKDKKGKKKKKWVEPVKQAKINCEYNLYLQDDTNADCALFQWYYFSVMNIKADTVMRINICNLSKPNGLYAKGMRPSVYSTNRMKAKGIGWTRGGENVQYAANDRSARYSKKTLDAHWVVDGSVPVEEESYK